MSRRCSPGSPTCRRARRAAIPNSIGALGERHPAQCRRTHSTAATGSPTAVASQAGPKFASRSSGRRPSSFGRSRRATLRLPHSPTNCATGRPRRAAGSPTRSTSPTRSSRSTSPARSPIRPRSCSRRRWPRSRRQSRPIGRLLPEAVVDDGLLSDAQLESVDLCRRSPLRPSRRRLDGRRDLRRRLGRAGERRERRPLPPRLVPRRRHRRRQGPTGRRHPPRQLAAGPAPRGLDLQVRQAARRRPARLVGTRPGEAPRAAAVPLSGRARRSASPKASSSPPTRRCARRSARARSPGSHQIIDWLGADFDGVIVFDEAHAMANAAGGKGERGDAAPSQQGMAGLRLQHALPDARVVYVSATGATARREPRLRPAPRPLGRRGFPFANRAEFVDGDRGRRRRRDGGARARPQGARPLRCRGRSPTKASSTRSRARADRPSRSASTMPMPTPSRSSTTISTAALEAANITGNAGTLNRNAKSAARSAFESTKQRFFNHLITSMKTPTLIRAIERRPRATATPPSSRSSRPAKR